MSDYSFQDECLEIMKNNAVGQIILPTGSGKTRIEFEYAKSKLVRRDDKHQVVIIVAPRIILCQQLIRNFFSFLLDKYSSVEENFIFCSSGRFPSGLKIGKKNFDGIYTTKIDDIAKNIKNAWKVGIDNVVFSTYKSFDRCVAGVKAGVADKSEVYLLADEAHYFTRKSDSNNDGSAFNSLKDNLKLFNTRFFFTATPRCSSAEDEDSSLMNNKEVYGPVIFSKQPKEMMAAGIICEPRLHNIIFEEEMTEENFSKVAGDFILKAFDKHQEIVTNNCGDLSLNDKIGAKVLVAVEGSKQLSMLLDNGFVEKANAKGISVFYTMSNVGTGSQSKTEEEEDFEKEELRIGEFLNKINTAGADDTAKMIVLHYNQLTEGIDVPAMTGLITMRGMVRDRAVQSIGRVLRVHPKDREKSLPDNKNWIKPYSYIIVPNLETTDGFGELVGCLREEYSASIVVEMSDVAIGKTVAQPIVQGLGDKKSPFKIINGALIHEVEEFDKKLEEQIETGQLDLF